MFQGENVLVTIIYYKDEEEYKLKLKPFQREAYKKMQTEIREIMRTRTTVILYSSKNIHHQIKKLW